MKHLYGFWIIFAICSLVLVSAVPQYNNPLNPTSLSELDDVAIGSQTDTQCLAWDSATSRWTPQTVNGSGGGGGNSSYNATYALWAYNHTIAANKTVYDTYSSSWGGSMDYTNVALTNKTNTFTENQSFWGEEVDLGINFDVVTKPVGATVALLDTPTGNVDNGQHYYYVSYYTAIGETELSTTNPTSVTVDATHKQVNITNLPVSSDYRVIGRKVYRTINSTTAYYYNVKLVDTIANNVDTSYVDNKADSELTGSNYFFRDNTAHKYITINNEPAMFVSPASTMLGMGAGYTTSRGTSQSSGNTLIGLNTGAVLTTGGTHTAVGSGALYQCTTGDSNTAVGSGALSNLVSGSSSTALGRNAGYWSNGGSNVYVGQTAGFGENGQVNHASTMVGAASGFQITSGNYNTFLGYRSGYTVTSGGSNIIIGASVTAPSTTGYNQLDIGNVIYGTGMYEPAGDSSVPTANGKIGIRQPNPTETLEVNGSLLADTLKTVFPVAVRNTFQPAGYYDPLQQNLLFSANYRMNVSVTSGAMKRWSDESDSTQSDIACMFGNTYECIHTRIPGNQSATLLINLTDSHGIFSSTDGLTYSSGYIYVYYYYTYKSNNISARFMNRSGAWVSATGITRLQAPTGIIDKIPVPISAYVKAIELTIGAETDRTVINQIEYQGTRVSWSETPVVDKYFNQNIVGRDWTFRDTNYNPVMKIQTSTNSRVNITSPLYVNESVYIGTPDTGTNTPLTLSGGSGGSYLIKLERTSGTTAKFGISLTQSAYTWSDTVNNKDTFSNYYNPTTTLYGNVSADVVAGARYAASTTDGRISVFKGSDGIGTDIRGNPLALEGGTSTGNATPANIYFTTSNTGTNGTTPQTKVVRMSIAGGTGHVGIGMGMNNASELLEINDSTRALMRWSLNSIQLAWIGNANALFSGASSTDFGILANKALILGSNASRQTVRIADGVVAINGTLTVNGSVNATTYYGDGSQLTGISGSAYNVTYHQSAFNWSAPVGGIMDYYGDPADLEGKCWTLANGSRGSPDLRGLFVIMASDSYTYNSTGGSATHSHTDEGHQHPDINSYAPLASDYNNDGTTVSGIDYASATFSVGNTGYAQLSTDDNMPPYYALYKIYRWC